MSDLAEKLATHRPAEGTRARATFAQLAKRWGFKAPFPGGDPYVYVDGMDGTETWKRLFGRGADATFELVEPAK